VALAVLVSGQGTLLEGLARRASDGRLPARIVAVVADRAEAPALERARRLGLPNHALPRTGPPTDAWAERLDGILRDAEAELVLLDGFLTVLPGPFVARWRGRILNIHPSLLPRHGGRGMYGAKVHEAVLAEGDPETGVTVHEVTGEIDAGPVLVQLRLQVLASDTPATLRERLRPLELEALTQAISAWRPPQGPGARGRSGSLGPPAPPTGRFS
jgi:phosphoribosylglycinamide formyltransferase-1